MLTPRTKKELSQAALDLANGLSLVSHNHVLYVPADFESLSIQNVLPERRVWLPLTLEEVAELGNSVQRIMFTTDNEKVSYYQMILQATPTVTAAKGHLLLKDGDTLVELSPDGTIGPPTQDFVPHYIQTPINHDEGLKDEVFKTLTEWTGTEDDAVSLLSHLATALSPHWPAVKYVLLIGEGRNGKSLLMKMVQALLGKRNVSYVTRQDMSNSRPSCLDLSSKMVNIVFDGSSTYLKDSGPEKSLIAGDPTPIRRLFTSTNTQVQTNGLFIEGLNREPKTGDKSSALQKRLVRFGFNKVYALDHAFERHMLSEPVLGAFLSLLLDHYVLEDDVATRLAPTKGSKILAMEQMFTNSLPFQFLAWLDDDDPLGIEGLLHEPISDVVVKFKQWRSSVMLDMNVWNDRDVEQMLLPLFVTERKSKRINGRPRHIRKITDFRQELSEFITYIRGEEDANDDDTLVAKPDLQQEPAPATDQPV